MHIKCYFFLHFFSETEEPNSSDSDSIEDKPSQRQRRLSYTLDEPSPVLVAYMQRFGQARPNSEAVVRFDEILFTTFAFFSVVIKR